MDQFGTVLEFTDYAIIALVVAVFAGAAAHATRPKLDLQRLERQLRAVEQKLDALLKHQGVPLPATPPSGLSPEVERMARDPRQKIAAIKLHREQHPGLGLAEAKDEVEGFITSRR